MCSADVYIRRGAAICLVLAGLISSPFSFGQEIEPNLRWAEPVRISAAERPRIDGRPDEEVWLNAPVMDTFVQREPESGQPATERTEVRLLFDDDALYVAFWCYTRDPETIVARLGRRDVYVPSDRVSINIDSYGDRRTAFSFLLNAAGVKQDFLIYDDTSEDASWDAVWEGAAARTEDGWTAEFRIPFSQLRFSDDSDRPWGIQFSRDIFANGETSFWSPVAQNDAGFVSRFGRMHRPEGVRTPRRVELMPYVASRLTRAPGDAGNPFYQANQLSPNLGADAKVGVSGNLTLTATINPDFGQVEADPAVVNLTAFETFFEERRPFFVEGADAFSFGRTRSLHVNTRPIFFYSRRIGREPAAFRDLYPGIGYQWLDAPTQTTIAGAAKLSGRVGPWSVGLLNAYTLSESARVIDNDGQEQRLRIAPPSSFYVGRTQRSWSDGATVAGAFGSRVMRMPLGGGAMQEEALVGYLPTSAAVLGLDGQHSWSDRAWSVGGVAAYSRVSGDSRAISTLQRASQRYLQRPDARSFEFDPLATAMRGYHAEASIQHASGRSPWRASFTATATSPGFEVNDVGFQTRADFLTANGYLEHFISRPIGPMRWLGLYSLGTFATNYDGDAILGMAMGGAYTQFANLWSGYLVGRVVAPSPSDRITRGGHMAARVGEAHLLAQLVTDRRKLVALVPNVDLRTGEFGRRAAYVGLGVTVRPTAALEVGVTPRFGRDLEPFQYVGSVSRQSPGGGPPGDFPRYVFAEIDQTSLDVGVRVNWTFRPNLTLQLYAQPFVATGQYDQFKELDRPRSLDALVYGQDIGTATQTENGTRIEPGDRSSFTIPDLDFTYRSLRGNAVLRWEFRPGSTMFLVWQQRRTDFVSFQDATLIDDLGAIFRAPVENVLLLKASFWWGR
ncbi:hypothetical protein BH23BAC4_BH23BAC4_16960 [soil metagenome]